MNVERLNTLCIKVQEDFTHIGLEQQFTALVQSLVNFASNPAPPHQQAFSQAIEAIYSALDNSELNDLNPVWIQLLQELFGYEVTGKRLKDNIKNIVERNNMTPAIAQTELNSLHGHFQKFNSGVTQVVAGLNALQIGTDDLEHGKCELGVLIPRAAVNFHLRDFGIEVERLDKIISPFTELTTGNRDGHELRTIASSDFLVNVGMWADTAKAVAEAVVAIVAAYVAVVKVRETKNILVETNADEQTISTVENHANTLMDSRIEMLTQSIIEEHGTGQIEEGRKHELRTEIKVSLRNIANRIDRGYHFEIRTGPVIEGDEEDAISSDDAELNSKLEKINELAKQLEYHRVEGEPILSLDVDEEVDLTK